MLDIKTQKLDMGGPINKVMKAFDKVTHRRIVGKVDDIYFDIRGINDFLNNITQRMFVMNTKLPYDRWNNMTVSWVSYRLFYTSTTCTIPWTITHTCSVQIQTEIM